MRPITRQLVTGGPGTAAPGSGYRWIALSNTTLGTLMATINGSIILIALPDIFRGIGVNPLLPGNASLLLWMIQHGYSFSQTPLWAGIAMLPLTIGFLAAGPVSGALSDRFGARASLLAACSSPRRRSYCWTCCRSTSPTGSSR